MPEPNSLSNDVAKITPFCLISKFKLGKNGNIFSACLWGAFFKLIFFSKIELLLSLAKQFFYAFVYILYLFVA